MTGSRVGRIFWLVASVAALVGSGSSVRALEKDGTPAISSDQWERDVREGDTFKGDVANASTDFVF